VHNNKYSYHKVDYSRYINSNSTIIITCPIHGDFEQTTIVHLKGHGCKKCADIQGTSLRRSSIGDFVIKANIKHNNKYSYEKTTYINANIKTIITCPIHGDFEQTPANHLNGSIGCLKCSIIKRSTDAKLPKEVFINRCNQIHSNKYDYNKVDYINNNTKVIITCKKHGDFEQTPGSHLSGEGCKKCATDKVKNIFKSNTKEFINKANLIHNNKYSYVQVTYKGLHKKIIIKCSKHGDFLQSPAKHLSGQGCPKCRESIGEKQTALILDKHRIKYIREYKINGYKYRYDFYLPDYNIYIEYHGEQHYKNNNRFGSNDVFDRTQRNDKIKIELVKRSTGLLITLKYTFNTLEKIEDELLRLFSIIHPEFLCNKELTKQMVIDSNVYLIQDGISYIRK
jgi:hypothetical protein